MPYSFIWTGCRSQDSLRLASEHIARARSTHWVTKPARAGGGKQVRVWECKSLVRALRLPQQTILKAIAKSNRPATTTNSTTTTTTTFTSTVTISAPTTTTIPTTTPSSTGAPSSISSTATQHAQPVYYARGDPATTTSGRVLKGECVVQAYVSNPLLLGGRKMDLRAYGESDLTFVLPLFKLCLLDFTFILHTHRRAHTHWICLSYSCRYLTLLTTCTHPPHTTCHPPSSHTTPFSTVLVAWGRIWLYREGLVRRASRPYSLHPLGDPYVHVTNNCVNRRNHARHGAAENLLFSELCSRTTWNPAQQQTTRKPSSQTCPPPSAAPSPSPPSSSLSPSPLPSYPSPSPPPSHSHLETRPPSAGAVTQRPSNQISRHILDQKVWDTRVFPQMKALAVETFQRGLLEHKAVREARAALPVRKRSKAVGRRWCS